ncbi:MAG: zinc dependent phospholipase C family protein [Bacteroidota bacterium]
MKKHKLFLSAVITLFLLSVSIDALGWGFWGHKEISRGAITLLPKEMMPFFQAHRGYVIEHSVDPDKARKEDSLEQFNHFIDIDYYGKYPFTELPRSYDDAAAKFTADTLREYGLLPWKIDEFTRKLSEAMKSGDSLKIMFHAAYLSHYVADAHVPLHATLNYDGQFSDQKGVHRRFESDMPERYGRDFQYKWPDSLSVIENPLENAFAVVLHSYTMLDDLLAADKAALTAYPAPPATEGERRPRMTDEYYTEFRKRLGDTPERRIEAAMAAVASHWYTAWVMAGRPELKP